MRLLTERVPSWQKQVVEGFGCLMVLVGTLPVLSACLTLALLLLSSDVGAATADKQRVAIAALTVLLITIISGTLLFVHARRSRRRQQSRPLTMPSVVPLAGVYGLALAVAGVFSPMGGLGPLFFAPAFLVAATLPSLAAVSGFANQTREPLAWRHAIWAFVGGATVAVAAALVLELLLPAFFLTLILNLATTVMSELESLIAALSRGEVAAAVTSPGFLYAFIQLALFAPFAEELAKSLITLPLVARVSRHNAFLLSALAGAGFAALENALYAGLGLSFWAGILLVRAVGCAIHPLGAGLMGLGWRAVLQKRPGAGRVWLLNFGAAVGIHALWNGGSLLVITLAGARFLGSLPPQIDILGFSAGGATLAFLIILGAAALGLGRRALSSTEADLSAHGAAPQLPVLAFDFSDRGIALWAIACLIALAPAGIAGLKLILGGG